MLRTGRGVESFFEMMECFWIERDGRNLYVGVLEEEECMFGQVYRNDVLDFLVAGVGGLDCCTSDDDSPIVSPGRFLATGLSNELYSLLARRMDFLSVLLFEQAMYISGMRQLIEVERELVTGVDCPAFVPSLTLGVVMSGLANFQHLPNWHLFSRFLGGTSEAHWDRTIRWPMVTLNAELKARLVEHARERQHTRLKVTEEMHGHLFYSSGASLADQAPRLFGSSFAHQRNELVPIDVLSRCTGELAMRYVNDLPEREFSPGAESEDDEDWITN